MNKNLHAGFTLIELLVVIAIIGILSSVVLAALNNARDKGGNAGVKSNLNNIRGQAELVYDIASGNYGAVCANPNVAKGIAAAGTAAGKSYGTNFTTNWFCNNASNGWLAVSPLKVAEGTGGTLIAWCVDNTGTSRGVPASATITASTTIVCP